MDMQIKVIPNDKPLKKSVMAHERVKLTMVGQFAKDLVSCVAVADLARRNGIYLTNNEIVAKACELAENFYATADNLGWLLELPPLEDLMEDDSTPAGFRAAVVK